MLVFKESSVCLLQSSHGFLEDKEEESQGLTVVTAGVRVTVLV